MNNAHFVVLGYLSYHLLVMYELSQNNASLNPIRYVIDRWAKVGLSTTGAIMAYYLVKAGLPEDAPEILIIGAYMSAGLFPYQAFDYLGKKFGSIEIDTCEITSEEVDEEPEYQKLPKFQAHDVTTWIKRK